MAWRIRNAFLFALTLTILCAYSISARPAKLRRLQDGVWGGQHIQISVDGNRATVEYDCANGTISGPLTLNSRGGFRWRGTFTPEHHGPRRDETDSPQPAIYSGSVRGSTMTLTVKLSATGATVGTYVLVRGGSGRVFKCR